METDMSNANTAEFRLGDHLIRKFSRLDAAFGAKDSDYPRYESIPAEFKRFRGNRHVDAVSGLFFNGGKLADHGLTIKEGVDREAFMTALQALLSSFAPEHELKIATCGWLLSEYTDEIPTKARSDRKRT